MFDIQAKTEVAIGGPGAREASQPPDVVTAGVLGTAVDASAAGVDRIFLIEAPRVAVFEGNRRLVGRGNGNARGNDHQVRQPQELPFAEVVRARVERIEVADGTPIECAATGSDIDMGRQAWPPTAFR